MKLLIFKHLETGLEAVMFVKTEDEHLIEGGAFAPPGFTNKNCKYVEHDVPKEMEGKIQKAFEFGKAYVYKQGQANAGRRDYKLMVN